MTLLCRPQQNGVAEWVKKIVVIKAISML
jgi:hypothetical protein